MNKEKSHDRKCLMTGSVSSFDSFNLKKFCSENRNKSQFYKHTKYYFPTSISKTSCTYWLSQKEAYDKSLEKTLEKADLNCEL